MGHRVRWNVSKGTGLVIIACGSLLDPFICEGSCLLPLHTLAQDFVGLGNDLRDFSSISSKAGGFGKFSDFAFGSRILFAFDRFNFRIGSSCT